MKLSILILLAITFASCRQRSTSSIKGTLGDSIGCIKDKGELNIEISYSFGSLNEDQKSITINKFLDGKCSFDKSVKPDLVLPYESTVSFDNRFVSFSKGNDKVILIKSTKNDNPFKDAILYSYNDSRSFPEFSKVTDCRKKKDGFYYKIYLMETVAADTATILLLAYKDINCKKFPFRPLSKIRDAEIKDNTYSLYTLDQNGKKVYGDVFKFTAESSN